MKNILPILLCYVLMTSQVFAVSGGPVFNKGGINPVGTYSGLIQVNDEKDYAGGVTNPNNTNVVPAVTDNPNAIGLFSLGVPTTSVATGAFLVFVDGVVFTGTITASVNPDTDQLSGIVNATYQYTLEVTTTSTTTSTTGTTTTTTVTPEAVTAQANGQITAALSGSRSGSLSSATLKGKSTIAIADGGVSGFQFIVNRVLDCTVVGFRQSTTSTTVGSVTSGTTGT